MANLTGHPVYPVEEMDGYGGYIGWKMIEIFIDSIECRGVPFSTGRDAVNVLKVIDATYRSHVEGRLSTIDYCET